MDIYPLPELKMYWGLGGSVIYFESICICISHQRFTDKRNALSMDNKDTLFQNICINSRLICKVSYEFAVDEMLRLFKGRYINKISIPNKPTGIGVKAYLIGDSNSKLPVWYSISGGGEDDENVPEMQTYAKIAANLVNIY